MPADFYELGERVLDYVGLVIEGLGLSPTLALILLLTALPLSFLNIGFNTIWLKPYFFVPFRKDSVEYWVSMNGAGALIPMGLAVYQLAGEMSFSNALWATIPVTILAFLFSRVKRGLGILVKVFALTLASVLVGPIFSTDAPIATTFFAAVFAVVIGADGIRGFWILIRYKQAVIIGGAGILDAIVLIPVFAVFIVPLHFYVERILSFLG